MTPRSASFFQALASLRPRRLAPGESGTLHVVVSLRPARVVLPSGHIELHLDEESSPLQYGPIKRKPARVAELEERFKGQEVYDDSIEFEVPVTALAEAKADKHILKGYVRLDVTEATTGKSLGRITGSLMGYANIGASLPRPGVSRAAADDGPAVQTEAPAGEDGKSPGVSGQGGSQAGSGAGGETQASLERVATEADGIGEDVLPMRPDPVGWDSLLGWLAMIGAVVLVLVLLVLGMRRR